MLSTYRLRADELSQDFLKALQDVYHDREIEIVVTDIVDETDYLLRSEANREHLKKAIADINTGSNLVSMSVDSLPSA